MAKPSSYLIPNLAQGVSQQADAQRDPTQAQAQVNAVSSLGEGLRKRDCTVALARVFSGTGGAVIDLPAASSTLVPQVPQVGIGATVELPAAGFILAPQEPIIGIGGGVELPAASFSLAPQAPVVAGDAFDFSKVSLLLLGDGPDNSTSIIDSSSYGLPMTAEGNARIRTAESKFAPSSIYCDGAGDRVSTPYDPVLGFGLNEPFTFECFFRTAVNPASYVDQFAQIAGRGNGVIGAGYALSLFLSKFYFAWNDGNTWGMSGTTTIVAGQWYHGAAVRKPDGECLLFLDGVQEDSQLTPCGEIEGTESFNVGDRRPGDPGGQYPFNGYIEQVRLIKGVALYTSNFTPPTAPFPTS